MRKTKADATKKRPQIGLPSSILDDSDEESCASTTSSSESESEYRGSSASDSTPNSEDRSSDDSSTDGGRTTARRKRASLLEDNSSESDSDVGTKPTRKVVPKKRVKRQESDSDADAATQDKKRIAKETAAKRKLRQSKLMALSKKMKSRIPNRRRRSKGTDEEEKDAKDAEDGGDDAEDAAVKASVDEGDGEEKEDTDVVETDRLIGSSEEEEGADSGSLKDFIVEDEKKKEDNKEDDDDNELDPQDKAILSLPREFIKGSHLNHFQVVVKALLINVLDETFLKSLYDGERRKRYAQEMKTSLFHFDERTILPRLENLKQRSRWTDRYKERVECYPKVRLAQIGLYRNTCDACLLQRQTSVSVRLSGQLYDSKSLQEDSFMPNDTQAFSVGSVCARRTEVYHILKHFKYHLFQHCRTVLEEEKSGEEEPVKDTVNRVFDKLQQGGWISEQYEKFQDHLNNADYFQEEKLD